MKKRDKIKMMAAAVMMVFAASCFWAMTAICGMKVSARELESYYREKEQILVEDARVFLNGEGFSDSGLMLTRVVEADGSRQYTLTVHHRKIDKMNEEERQFLMRELQNIVFEDANSTFICKFLINQ